jgi:hypothetical protein
MVFRVDRLMKPSEITVEMTLSWTINKKDWSYQKELVKELVNNPKVVLGNDLVYSMYMLNDLDYPEAKDIRVVPV